MPPSSPPPRAAFAALADADLDVLVIGGGINGISITRDLALQGVTVALVDRGDVMSGASAASSHMVHGGIRYLENGEFRLVRESVQERNDLLTTAPHVVKPLRTTVPVYSVFSGLFRAPGRMLHIGGARARSARGALLIGVGLVIYETFSRAGGSMPRFAFRGRRRSLAELPSLDPRAIGTMTYYDASMHEPERLALDLVADALTTGRAQVVTYAEAVATHDGRVVVRDALTNTRTAVQARVVVNASGPFTDLTNTALGRATSFMGGTKGSHIVVDHPPLYDELAARELFLENDDGRIVLIYPVKGRVLIGTTDVFADPRDAVRCTEEEVDYFFDLVRHVLPGIHLDRSQIVFRFAGIRPLPRQDESQPGFVSRDYHVNEDTLPGTEIPLISVVGGKWTTFRALGERVTRDVLSILGRNRRVSTRGLPIGGGRGFPRSSEDRAAWVAGRSGTLAPARVESLLARYGTRADRFIQLLERSGDTALVTLPSYSAEELVHLALTEHVVHLEDLLLRRTPLAFSGELTPERVDEIARAVSCPLKWSDSRVQTETTALWEVLADRHGVRAVATSRH